MKSSLNNNTGTERAVDLFDNETSLSFIDEHTPHAKTILAERLRVAMEEQHLFTEPSLKIEELAEHLCASRTLLSHFIKETYGCGYSQLLASYRIEYAKSYMLENRHELMQRVAAECGFASEQSFSRKFSQFVGLPPRVWLINQK